MSNLIGVKTKYFSDVKIKVKAGMQFGTKDCKLKVIGYDIYRHYFDTPEKDMQIGSTRLKRTLKY